MMSIDVNRQGPPGQGLVQHASEIGKEMVQVEDGGGVLGERLGPGVLPRGPASTAVADAIRHAIVTDKLQPGDRLKQEELMQHFGVSVGPVRESLRTLESEGIVASVARKGYIVAQVSLDELEFILPVRLVLEEVAFLRLQRTMDEEILSSLEGAIAKIREAAARGSVSDVNEADQAFHEMAMTTGSGSPQAVRLWRLVMPRVRMLFNMLTPMHESLSAVAKEHEILLEAVRSGSRILLQSELEKHITSQPLAFLREWNDEQSLRQTM